MPRISLPIFAGYLVTSGAPKVTKVLEARRSQESSEPYVKGDHYVHLRGPLRDATKFEAQAIGKRAWTHGGLQVSVNPTARIKIGEAWHVAYVHLKADDLNARVAAPVLELIKLSHGDLGSPLIVGTRTGKVHRPSRSTTTRRGMTALLEAEAEAFVRLWHGVAEVA
jgi:hypothetical protein